jgi:acyl dehydratase
MNHQMHFKKDDIHFEDYVVGHIVNIEKKYVVTQEEIINIASKWDPQPFHVDPVAAKDSIFGGLVASSAHAFPIFVYLGQQGGRGVAAISALGFDKLRFLTPIRPDDELRYEYCCLEKRISTSRPYAGIVRCEGRLINQNGDVVFSGEVASLVQRREII